MERAGSGTASMAFFAAASSPERTAPPTSRPVVPEGTLTPPISMNLMTARMAESRPRPIMA